MRKEERWDYALLQGLSKCLKPQKPEDYHSIKNIKKGNNGATENTKKYVIKLLKELPPETFLRLPKDDGGKL